MKIQATISAIALLAFLPLAAGAQGFNNININLNDVMVGQRMQEMSQKLNDANSSATLKVKRHHQKHDKKNKDQNTAAIQKTDDSMTTNTESVVSATNSQSDSF